MLKKRARLFLCLLALVFALCLPALAAEETVPGYVVSGTLLEGGELTVTVSLRAANAVGGSFALRFDPDKLQLRGGETLSAAVAGQGVVLTPQGLQDSQTASNSQGYLLGAWYPGGSRLDAREEDKEVFSAVLTLAPGVAAGDLDGASLGLYDLRAGQFKGWESGASLSVDTGEQLKFYRYNQAEYDGCAIVLDYPGHDREPENARAVTFRMADMLGAPVKAQVTVAGRAVTADRGTAVIKLTPGSYSYCARLEGFETLSGVIAVEDVPLEKKLTFRNDAQLAQVVASGLEIIYAKGDSADHVTAAVGLPLTGADRTRITWTSSNPDVLDGAGGVFPADTAKRITLTATVTKGDATAQRTFVLTVLPKEQQNPNPVYPDDPEPPDDDPQPGPGPSFGDLEGVEWAHEAIFALTDAGIIKGVSDTEFCPNAQISRADFVVLLMRLLAPEADSSQTAPFPDVAPGSYYYQAVMQAKTLGIVQGDGSGKFLPGSSITRQEMMTITYRALLKFSLMEPQTDLSILEKFQDGGTVAEYAKESAAAMTASGLITGTGTERLAPLENTSRAQSAVLIYRIYTLKGER